jgi:hypothetical protein
MKTAMERQPGQKELWFKKTHGGSQGIGVNKIATVYIEHTVGDSEV